MPDPVPQLTGADLSTMSTEQIVKAREAGQLEELLGRRVPDTLPDDQDNPAPITEADLATMTPDAIVKTRREGRLDHLMRPSHKGA